MSTERRALLGALALVVAVFGCDGAQGTFAPDRAAELTLRVADTAGSKLIMYMPDDDNVQCWGGSDGYWICFHQNEDYGSPWSNPIVNYCSLYPETCMFIPNGGGSGIANPVFPINGTQDADAGAGLDSLPTSCPSSSAAVKSTYPDNPNRASRAWCLGTDLSSVTVYKTRVQTALGRVRAKGGACASLADLGDLLVANNRIRIFAHESVAPGVMGAASYIGGALPEVGGPLSKWSFFSISERFTKFAIDPQHPDEATTLTLDAMLVHEMLHLLGEDHDPNTSNPSRNPGELACL